MKIDIKPIFIGFYNIIKVFIRKNRDGNVMELDNIIDNKKLLVFDMDGTLLDSMELWRYLGRIYLKSKGKEVKDNLEEVIDCMTLEESASYFKSNYNLNEDINVIEKEIISFIENKYLNDIPLKSGVKEYLQELHKEGYKMCVLTTSEKKQAISALRRTGILDLFDKVYTDKDFTMSKTNPQIYIKVCERMNEAPQNTVVFEDALYAIESAKNANCTVIGVYDEYYKNDWNKIQSIADGTIYNF